MNQEDRPRDLAREFAPPVLSFSARRLAFGLGVGILALSLLIVWATWYFSDAFFALWGTMGMLAGVVLSSGYIAATR